jgi:hypothetical protein
LKPNQAMIDTMEIDHLIARDKDKGVYGVYSFGGYS